MKCQQAFYQTDSVSVFKPFWQLWRLLGILAWGKRKNFSTVCYDICMNLFIYIWYNVHLVIGLFLLPEQGDIIKNLSMTLTCIVCSMKHYCLRWNLKKINDMMDLFAKLDQRLCTEDERRYYSEISIKRAKVLTKMYFVAYMGANFFALVALLWDNERRLMYPAWFPFEWNSSWLLYAAAICYQFFGITILIIINFTNDAIAPVTLCLFSGQVHVLCMRIAALGYDSKKTLQQHEHELKLCVKDHLKLLSLFTATENSLSFAQLILFISSGLNICLALVYLVFFVENLFSFIYYTSFLGAIAVELFPTYYYGTLLQEEFNSLTYSIFTSNWLSQSRSYRRSVLIFAEVTLREFKMLAGGIVTIRLDSFFAICKMTYSLFALAIQLK